MRIWPAIKVYSDMYRRDPRWRDPTMRYQQIAVPTRTFNKVRRMSGRPQFCGQTYFSLQPAFGSFIWIERKIFELKNGWIVLRRKDQRLRSDERAQRGER